MAEAGKITVVSSGLKETFSPYAEQTGISLKKPYRSDSFLIRNLRKIKGSTVTRGIEKSYNAELKGMKGTVIVFDPCIKEHFMHWLKEKNPGARIIYWYWNPAGMSFNMNPRLAPDGVELWTYSETDARKYGMRMNTPFYFKAMAKRYSSGSILYDVCFIGADKGRMPYIKKLEKFFGQAGISSYLAVMPEHWFMRYFNRRYQKEMPYREVIRKTSQASCILDIYTDKKSGLSLRVMEALFLGRKLITNNEMIKEADFYHPDNIYLLDKTNMEGITEFLQMPFQKTDSRLTEKYDFKNWLGRFYDSNS